jgi:hypothetical protein
MNTLSLILLNYYENLDIVSVSVMNSDCVKLRWTCNGFRPSKGGFRMAFGQHTVSRLRDKAGYKTIMLQ